MYFAHFRTNLGMIRHDFPNLHRWLQHLYWEHPAAFKDTTNFEHIKTHCASGALRYSSLSLSLSLHCARLHSAGP